MDKRTFLRVPVDFKTEIQTAELIEGKVVNLSDKGIGLELDSSLQMPSTYLLNIDLSPRYSAMQLKINVLWEKHLPESGKNLYGGEIIDLTQNNKTILQKILDRAETQYHRIPPDKMLNQQDHNKDSVTARREWLTKKTQTMFKHIKHYSITPDKIKANIENFIGVSQMPLGIAGPLKVKGEHAKGVYYVPFATTEGTLVATYQMGMLAIMKAGGANVTITKNTLDISPLFKFGDIFEAKSFMTWVQENFISIKQEAEKTTKHGKLLEIKPYSLGTNVILNFQYNTGDAMGLNMVNIATNHACNYIQKQVKTNGFYLRSNLSSDKKASFFNLINSYGKEVNAEIKISKEIMRKYLRTTPEKVYDFCWRGTIAGIQAGMVGANAHFANGLAAIFIACGQDVAQIVNASIGMSMPELTAEKELHLTLKLPNLIVGTVGGGMKIGSHRECLELMGCYGEGKSKKLAEIIGATLLAGELAIYAALAEGNFSEAHLNKRKML